MTEKPRPKAWLSAIAEAAQDQGVSLPRFLGHGMGSARSEPLRDGRFITFKRRLVQPAQADIDGVEWTFWIEQNDRPTPIAAFREPQAPKPENVAEALALLRGWLIDGWTTAEARLAVARHPNAQTIEDPPPPREYKKDVWAIGK